MKILTENINISFPIYEAKQRSFKQMLLKSSTGGYINQDIGSILQVEALKDISLDINEGERIALLGHNGSGKTTLLRTLAGVYFPTTGKLSIDGKVTSLLDSMLGMDNDATGFENIRLRSLFLGLPKKQFNSILEDIVEFSELGNFLNLPLRTYSSGMILRLAFAISTCYTPEILLMDEWISLGDEHFKIKAEKRLKDFVDQAGILVFASHDDEIVDKIATRKIVLEHGAIKQ